VEVLPTLKEAGAVFAGARRLIAIEMPRLDPCGPQGVDLQIQPLLFGRGPRISDTFTHRVSFA